MQQLTERKHHNNNSKQLSGNFSLNQWYGGIGISLQNKSTNDISKEEHQKIFSNYCSALSTIGGPYTWSPPWYPDRCRFPCEPPTGCWLLANSSTVIYDSESSWWGLTVCGWAGTGFWKSIFIVNGKVGQQQSGLDESGLVELCWVSEYPPGPINILLH